MNNMLRIVPRFLGILSTNRLLVKSYLFVILIFLGTSFSYCHSDKSTSTKESEKPEKENVSEESSSIGKTIHLTREEFLTRVIDYVGDPEGLKYKGDKPCIVDFYADWCGPCRQAAPVMEQLAKEYHGEIYIYKVDTQKEQQLASELGIQGIPAFLFCPMDGQPFGSSGIAKTQEETKAMFKKMIDEQLLKKPAI